MPATLPGADSGEGSWLGGEQALGPLRVSGLLLSTSRGLLRGKLWGPASPGLGLQLAPIGSRGKSYSTTGPGLSLWPLLLPKGRSGKMRRGSTGTGAVLQPRPIWARSPSSSCPPKAGEDLPVFRLLGMRLGRKGVKLEGECLLLPLAVLQQAPSSGTRAMSHFIGSVFLHLLSRAFLFTAAGGEGLDMVVHPQHQVLRRGLGQQPKEMQFLRNDCAFGGSGGRVGVCVCAYGCKAGQACWQQEELPCVV